MTNDYDNTVLSLDDLFARSDAPASEPVPPRIDEQIHIFESASGAEVSCQPEGNGVRIRTIGELTEVHPTANDFDHLSIDDLARLSDVVPAPRPFRPKWLDLMIAPRLLPRPYGLFLPGTVMRPLSFEQAAQGYPWCTVGKLFIQRRGQKTQVGSGVLVGPNLLLTASHAMPWDTDDSSVRFVPNYRRGNDPRFGHAYVDRWRGIRNSDEVTGLDYVICQLNWRIGDRTGWMGTHWTSDEGWYYDNTWLSAGYPAASPSGGEMPSAEVPVWVKDIDNDGDGLEIETIHFTNGGWSGGPLWGELGSGPHVIGVDSGKEKDGLDPTRAVFAGGQHMVNLVKHGWANWV